MWNAAQVFVSAFSFFPSLSPSLYHVFGGQVQCYLADSVATQLVQHKGGNNVSLQRDMRIRMSSAPGQNMCNNVFICECLFLVTFLYNFLLLHVVFFLCAELFLLRICFFLFIFFLFLRCLCGVWRGNKFLNKRNAQLATLGAILPLHTHTHTYYTQLHTHTHTLAACCLRVFVTLFVLASSFLVSFSFYCCADQSCEIVKFSFLSAVLFFSIFFIYFLLCCF